MKSVSKYLACLPWWGITAIVFTSVSSNFVSSRGWYLLQSSSSNHIYLWGYSLVSSASQAGALVLKFCYRREIFARRAMVDQALECLRYLRKTWHFRVLNTEKFVRSDIFFLVSHFECEIECSTCDISQQQWDIFVVMLAMESYTVACFAWQGRKGCVTADI